MLKPLPLRTCLLVLLGWLPPVAVAVANIAGGGTGTCPNVKVTDNGDGTVTMANGVVSIHVIKSGATIDQINYTYNNGRNWRFPAQCRRNSVNQSRGWTMDAGCTNQFDTAGNFVLTNTTSPNLPPTFYRL